MMMTIISLVVVDPFLLIKGMMHWIRTTVLQSTVRHAHHPGSREYYLLLKDNRRLRSESLVVSGKYLLDLIMSMGIIGTLSIYIERIDIVLLERSVMRTSRKEYLTHHKASSKWFLDLALPPPETATMTRLRTQSHSWLN